MFSAGEYLSFCAGALALIASPGPDFFYVASRGAALGARAGMVAALGIGSGLALHTVGAVSGLTLVLLASPTAFGFVKWIGAAYLLWLAWNLWRDEPTSTQAQAGQVATGESNPKSGPRLGVVWRQGVLTNALNPKVALTFAAFLPAFLHPERGGAALQVAILGATLCVLATLWFCGIGIGAARIGSRIGGSWRARRAVRRGAACALVLLALRLALATSA